MDEVFLAPVEHKALSDGVLSALRQAILSGHLKSGHRLVEAGIAKRMGVSRAPVREAIRLLEREGLVVVLPYRGAFVAHMSEQDIREIYSLRSAIEGLAVRLAIGRLRPELVCQLQEMVDGMRRFALAGDLSQLVERDLRFHQLLCEASGHQRLLQVWLGLSLQIRFFLTTIVRIDLGLEGIADRHQQMLDSVLSGDADLAQQSVERNLVESGERFIRGMKPAAPLLATYPSSVVVAGRSL